MKGFRRLKVGEVIREGDIFLLRGVSKPAKFIGCALDKHLLNHYRPLTKKPVNAEKWKHEMSNEAKVFWSVFDCNGKVRARVWSLHDARLIVGAVNKYLSGVRR